MHRHTLRPRAPRPGLLDHLEARRLLSADVPDAGSGGEIDNNRPEVVAVYVNSTTWTPAFRAAVEDSNDGSAAYGVEVKANGNNNVLPFINLDQISIEFNENVYIQQDDVRIEGVDGEYDVVAFTYDPETFVATFTLDGPIGADRVTVEVDGDSPAGVTDTAGNPLRGNARGDDDDDDGDDDDDDDDGSGGNGGRDGRDFEQELAVLPGDVTRDGRVNAIDIAAVRARANRTPDSPGLGGARYGVFYDVNGDARINAVDIAAVRARANTTLPDVDDDDDDGGGD